jgi:hypothetical protein
MISTFTQRTTTFDYWAFWQSEKARFASDPYGYLAMEAQAVMVIAVCTITITELL